MPSPRQITAADIALFSDRILVEAQSGTSTQKVAAAMAAAISSGEKTIYFSGTTPRDFVYARPTAGVTQIFDGEVDRTKLGGAAGFVAQNAIFGVLAGNHPTSQRSLQYIRALAEGSEQIGAEYADYALSAHVEKEHWFESTGTPKGGEINTLTLFYRNGGPRVSLGGTRQNDWDNGIGISSGSAILMNCGATYGSGATQIIEAVNSVFDIAAGGVISHAMNFNVGNMTTRPQDEGYYGVVMTAQKGALTNAFMVKDETGGSWQYILQNIKGGIQNFYINSDGKLRWRATNDATKHISAALEATAGDFAFKNGAESVLMRLFNDPDKGINLRDRQIIVKSGTPEGAVTADAGSLYLRSNGTNGIHAYVKSGSGTNTGWLPLLERLAGTTAGRPANVNAIGFRGYMFFDSTLNKPIWWDGAAWRDATGNTV